MQAPVDRLARRYRCRAAILAALATSASFAMRAKAVRADPSRFELSWSAPPDCPGREKVRSEIERILHGDGQLAENERLSVRAEVRAAREGGSWRVDLETDNGRRVARRRIDAASCEELANATALFVAILIDPRVASEAATDAPTERAPSAIEAPREENRSASPSLDRPPLGAVNEDRNRTSPAWWVGLAAGARGGYLPSWSAGLGIHGRAAWKAIHAEIGGFAWLPRREAVDATGAQGADFRLLSAYSQLCLEMTSAGWALGPCAGIELVNLQGTGFGPGVVAETRSATFVGALAGARLRWTGSERFSIPVDVGVTIPFRAPRFVFTGSDPEAVHAPSALGVRLTVGAEFRL